MARPFAPVHVPPLPEQKGEAYTRLVEMMQRLLAPDGCPWDREQTPASLRRYVLEEACEVIDAIDSGDTKSLREELGDLLLQVVFLGELMRNEGRFGPDDVVQGIAEKLGAHQGGGKKGPRALGERAAESSGADARAADWREGGARRVRLARRARVARQGGRRDRRARPR